VTIARAAIDGIVAHARETSPAECCGLLLGRGDDVTEAARARN
jgi:proteasome lid subunit RPN8/RPN11